MKRQIFKVVAMMTIALSVGFSRAELVVYEGFDYAPTDGSVAINGKSGGTGFSGNWSSLGTNGYKVYGGLSYGSLEVSGGATQRPQTSSAARSSRTLLAPASLVADGSTMWFSVLMNPVTDKNGIANQSFGTLILGDAAFNIPVQSSAPPILNSGNAIGVGFAGTDDGGTDFANMCIQGVTYKGGVLTQNAAERLKVGNTTVMVVGKVEWAANGTDDVVSLYNVSNLAVMPTMAFSTMTVDLDQSVFNVIAIGDAETSVFDEIRFGTTYADVVPVPEPATVSLLVLGGLGLLRRRHN
jgi:hypothetical protein